MPPLAPCPEEPLYPATTLFRALRVGAVATFSDITARKRTEDALRQSEANYRTLFEAICELLAANRALVEMVGYSSKNDLRAHRKQLSARPKQEGKLVIHDDCHGGGV